MYDQPNPNIAEISVKLPTDKNAPIGMGNVAAEFAATEDPTTTNEFLDLLRSIEMVWMVSRLKSNGGIISHVPVKPCSNRAVAMKFVSEQETQPEFEQARTVGRVDTETGEMRYKHGWAIMPMAISTGDLEANKHDLKTLLMRLQNQIEDLSTAELALKQLTA